MKKPVTAPATHSCRNDIRSQNSSADTAPSSPSAVRTASPPPSVFARFGFGDLSSPSVVYAISSMNRDLGSSSNDGITHPRFSPAAVLRFVPVASSAGGAGHGSGTPSTTLYGWPYTHPPASPPTACAASAALIPGST